MKTFREQTVANYKETINSSLIMAYRCLKRKKFSYFLSRILDVIKTYTYPIRSLKSWQVPLAFAPKDGECATVLRISKDDGSINVELSEWSTSCVVLLRHPLFKYYVWNLTENICDTDASYILIYFSSLVKEDGSFFSPEETANTILNVYNKPLDVPFYNRSSFIKAY